MRAIFRICGNESQPGLQLGGECNFFLLIKSRSPVKRHGMSQIMYDVRGGR